MALRLKSERQIQADMLATLISELGLNDINAGSVLDVLTQAVAQEDFAQYVQLAQVARMTNLDSLTGTDLDNKAFEFGLEREQAKKASGTIQILREASFVKVSTTFFAGSPAPLAGDTHIDVNDASSALYGTSGTLILGRGTPNEEEVTYSTAPVNNTNFYRITVSALAKDHAIEETVILKQGSDETILAGTEVVVPSTGTNEEIKFTITNDVTLLAGEDKVTGVPVLAVEPGTKGNIPIKAIEGTEAFPTEPFAGARAENTVKFTTGKDRETDDELRDSIRDHIQSLSKGVKVAILNAVVGLVDPDTAKRVVSANVVLPVSTSDPVKVYIDDGTGFEPSFESQGFESVLAKSTGGEERLQLDIFPLVKAQVETNLAEPYDMTGSPKTLTYNVGTQSETIQFSSGEFDFPESATAEEIVTIINNKATLIEARTSQSGARVTIMGKTDTNEDIQVTGGTANSILGFPTDKKSTLFLYIDDELKSKDGETAFIDSQNQAPFNLAAIGAFPQTLTVVVDKKTANSQTVTFQSADFSDTTAATVAEIVAVINAQLAGATAEAADNNTRVRIVSNTELSEASAIHITGGTANDATNGLNFSTTQVTGINGDYTLNRELGLLELNSPLTANSSVTAGSRFTRAKLRASLSELYSPGNGETLVIAVDGGSDQTITFDSTFAAGKSAEDTADFINAQLKGATAIVRTVGGLNYVEINTDTYDQAIGSIQIKSSSTANASFGFTLDTVKTNQKPHKAYRVSGNQGPFEFAEGNVLVVVLNDDSVNSTYSIVFDYDAVVTSGTSTTVFAASGLTNIFGSDDVLNDFYVAFVSGPNTTTGVATTVTNQGGNTWRYDFSALPANMANFAIGDIARISGMNESSNNGNFLITGISSAGNGYIEVTNASGIAESGATGDITIGQRRQITDYVASTGQITVGSAFSNTPANTNSMILLPSTIDNVVNFMNNTKVTSISTKADISGVDQNRKLQIASKKDGSEGYVQITGGSANSLFDFSTDVIRGLQGYNYYTGLLKLVQKTVYGDDTDLVSFPGVSAAGITVQILAPTVREVSFNLDIELKEGISIGAVENEVKSAITGYINNLGVGEDVIIEQVRARVIRIDGITDVTLNTPTANIAISDGELARTRDSLILLG